MKWSPIALGVNLYQDVAKSVWEVIIPLVPCSLGRFCPELKEALQDFFTIFQAAVLCFKEIAIETPGVCSHVLCSCYCYAIQELKANHVLGWRKRCSEHPFPPGGSEQCSLHSLPQDSAYYALLLELFSWGSLSMCTATLISLMLPLLDHYFQLSCGTGGVLLTDDLDPYLLHIPAELQVAKFTSCS